VLFTLWTTFCTFDWRGSLVCESAVESKTIASYYFIWLLTGQQKNVISFILGVPITSCRRVHTCLINLNCFAQNTMFTCLCVLLSVHSNGQVKLPSLAGCRTWCPTDLQHLCCKALINKLKNKFMRHKNRLLQHHVIKWHKLFKLWKCSDCVVLTWLCSEKILMDMYWLASLSE